MEQDKQNLLTILEMIAGFEIEDELRSRDRLIDKEMQKIVAKRLKRLKH